MGKEFSRRSGRPFGRNVSSTRPGYGKQKSGPKLLIRSYRGCSCTSPHRSLVHPIADYPARRVAVGDPIFGYLLWNVLERLDGKPVSQQLAGSPPADTFTVSMIAAALPVIGSGMSYA